MARRNLGKDAVLDDFIGDFASSPLGYRSSSVFGSFTGEGDDLAALLGADLDGSSRARHIAETLVQRELGERDGREGEPAVAPEANGIGLKAEGAGDLGVIGAIGGRENDAGAQGKVLREGAATQQRLKLAAHLRRELDDRRFWTSHSDTSHFERTVVR